MSSLRKCIELAGKAVNTAEADALHAAAKQYRDDGYDVQTAERMAVTDAHERTVAQHKSIYEQLGIATKEAGWKGKETTPVAAEAEPAKSDAEQYQEIQAKMAALGHDKTGSPEYQQLWAQSETIKNRNGGYVTEPAATEQAYDQHGIPQMKPGDARLDKSVKIEATRARTGEKVTVEMPAKKAIERMKARSELFEKLRKCIEG